MVERLHHQQATLTNSMLVSLLINQGNVIILIQLHYINLPFICSIFQAYQLEVKTKLFQKIWPYKKPTYGYHGWTHINTDKTA